MNLTKVNGNRRIAVVTGSMLAFTVALGAYFAAPALAVSSPVASKGSLAGTPCTASASACVDLDDQKAWLAKDGKVIGGPYRIASGGTNKETPLGTFKVIWKDKDHKSKEFPLPNGQPTPMPNAVFFAPGGIAFHGGDPSRASAGCVRVPLADSVKFFDTLQVGDEVQVVKPDNKKGGFYGVNNVKPPTKAEQAANEERIAANRRAAARLQAGGSATSSSSTDSTGGSTNSTKPDEPTKSSDSKKSKGSKDST